MSPTPSTPFRFEFKYPMSITQARLLEQEIRQLGLAPDAFSTYNDGSYDVTSLYFDSYDFYDYDEKAGGFQERKKIRLRIYEPFLDKSEYGFLEIKHKYGMTNKKSKVKLTRDEMEDLFAYGKRSLIEREWGDDEQELKEIILSHMILRNVKPSALVSYRRNAYMTPDKSVRITFDKNLRSKKTDTLHPQDFIVPVAPDTTIMEVKYQDILPYWMKPFIVKYGLKRQPYSKYEMSLDRLNRFNPIPR